MPSPFPGMDPYLEGALWPDVHQRLATEIGRQLTPQLRPRYVARLAIALITDTHPEAEIGIMDPDVEILESRPTPGEAARGLPAPTAAPLTIPVVPAVEVKVVTVEVRDVASNRLVTSIEILSPVNKREPGLEQYRLKRQRLYQAGVHLLELDLLRRGARVLAHPRLPEVAYLIALTRAHAPVAEVWPLQLRDPLPRLPVPLRAPDPDVTLDLAAAIDTIYDEAAYDLSINYDEAPPPPPLTPEEETWVQEVVAHREVR